MNGKYNVGENFYLRKNLPQPCQQTSKELYMRIYINVNRWARIRTYEFHLLLKQR